MTKTKDDETDHQSFEDWRGNTVSLGDTIVYPILSGRSAILALGIVRRIYVKSTDYYNPNRLDVEVLDKKWDWRRTEEEKAKRPISKLKFWSRCLLYETKAKREEPTMADMADMTEPW